MTRLILFMALLGFSGFAGATPQTQVSVSYDAEAFDAYMDAQQDVAEYNYSDIGPTNRQTCVAKRKKSKRKCHDRWKNNKDKRQKCLSKSFRKYRRCYERCRSKLDRKFDRCEHKKKRHKKKCIERARHWFKTKCHGTF